MPILEDVPEPWDSFFRELDGELTAEVCLWCVGGFAVTVQYGLPRPTADVDVLSILPADQREHVLSIACEGSRLYTKHGVHLQHMGGIVTLPENYEERVTELFPARYKRVRLFGLDPYDLALSKLERSDQRDRDDVKHLFRTLSLDLQVLEERYKKETEQRPYMSNEDRHDRTLNLWIAMLREVSERGR